VFENRVVRRKSGPKTNYEIRSWRVMLNEELRNSCSSPDIIKMIKPRRMKSTGHAACIEEEFMQGFGRKSGNNNTTRSIQM
jgi:hypothetical protein